jgi:hypothetical protein
MALARTSAQTSRSEPPDIEMDSDEVVYISSGPSVVSPDSTTTRSSGMSSSSAAIWRSAVTTLG